MYLYRAEIVEAVYMERDYTNNGTTIDSLCIFNIIITYNY